MTIPVKATEMQNANANTNSGNYSDNTKIIDEIMQELLDYSEIYNINAFAGFNISTFYNYLANTTSTVNVTNSTATAKSSATKRSGSNDFNAMVALCVDFSKRFDDFVKSSALTYDVEFIIHIDAIIHKLRNNYSGFQSFKPLFNDETAEEMQRLLSLPATQKLIENYAFAPNPCNDFCDSDDSDDFCYNCSQSYCSDDEENYCSKKIDSIKNVLINYCRNGCFDEEIIYSLQDYSKQQQQHETYNDLAFPAIVVLNIF